MNQQKTETKSLLYAWNAPRWVGLLFILPLLACSHLVWAQTTEPESIRFDHIKTGFNLTGAHIQSRCESCHIQGMFRGTPRDCATCHMPGNRMGATAKPNRHVATIAPCESCHRTTGWTPANFSHVSVTPGTCMTCHNGSSATAKPGGHILTTESCDKCHRTTAWSPAGYNHIGIAPGTCATCHNGSKATGKPGRHVVTTDSCDTCHRTTAWLPAGFNHIGVVPGTCRTCHGVTATGLPNGHVTIPATDSCDKCHSTRTWSGASYNHVGVVPGTCATCHNGTTAKGVGGSPTTRYPAYSGHLPTSRWPSCDICHKSTNSFTNARVHGSGAAVSGLCNVCHSKHNNSQSCDKCHSTSNWD